MDGEKIHRFLQSVNQGLEVASTRIQAEREYLQRIDTHLNALSDAIERLRQGPGTTSHSTMARLPSALPIPVAGPGQPDGYPQDPNAR